MKKTIIIVILLIFFLFMLKSCALFFPFSMSDIFGGREPDIPVPHTIYDEMSKPADVPVFNVPFRITDEMKNLKIDCNKEEDGSLKYKKAKTLCRNVYTATPEQVNSDLSGGKYDYMAFYGKYSIYHCPVNPERKIENLVEGCIESAKFFDNYLFPKMASVFGTAANRGFFTKRINVYIEEKMSYVTEVCKAPAIGCCLRDHPSILLPLGDNNNHFYPEGYSYTVGYYLMDISSDKYKGNMFQAIYPKNCVMAQYTMHELIHYFNYRMYGYAPSWFEETIDNIVEDELVTQVCPPGRKHRVFRYENNRYEEKKDVDINSDDFILYLEDKKFENNACYKMITTEANSMLNKGKLPYFTSIYNQLNGVAKKNFKVTLTTAELARAVYLSSGSDPAVRKNLYEIAKCPK